MDDSPVLCNRAGQSRTFEPCHEPAARQAQRAIDYHRRWPGGGHVLRVLARPQSARSNDGSGLAGAAASTGVAAYVAIAMGRDIFRPARIDQRDYFERSASMPRGGDPL